MFHLSLYCHWLTRLITKLWSKKRCGLRFKFSNTCMIHEKRKNTMKCHVLTDKIWLQEGNIARASCSRTRPGTASSAAADPRAASSARRGTVSPFDPRYQLHRIYRTHRMAISKCSTSRGTEGSTRAFKVSDEVDRRLFEGSRRELRF